MAYGTVKVDNITFDNGGSDQNVTVSGLYRATTSGVTLSGTIAATTVSGVTVIGSTTVSGATVTGTTANFTSGNFGNIISSAATMSGALIMANQQQVRFREAVGNGVNHIALQAPAIVSADQTITLPDQTGTVITTGDNGSVSSTMLATNLTISAAAGSASAPSIAFTGDLNTGIYSPGADQVAISTNGSASLSIDSIGNINVNRGSLVLSAVGPEGGELKLQNPTNTGTVYHLDANTATNARLFTTFNNTNLQIGQLEGTGGLIAFYTSTTERLRIDSSGNVAIGTSSPAQALHVSQSGGNNFAGIRTQNSNSGTGTAGLEFSSDATYAKAAVGLIRSGVNGVGSLVFYNASSTGAANWSTADERLRIDSSGNVGIGTTSPSQTLDVLGNIRSTSSVSNEVLLVGVEGAIELSRSDSGSYIDFKTTNLEDYDCRIHQVSNGLAFQTGGNGAAIERLRIDSSGNVGINTSTPTSKLEVIGEIRGVYSGFALLASNGSGTGQTSIGLRREGAPTDQKTWEIFQGASGEFTIRTISDSYASSQDVFSVYRGSGVGVDNVRLHTSGSERLRIDGVGNVGIGTSSPNYTLDLNSGGVTPAQISTTVNWNFPGFILRRNASNVSTAKMLGMMLQGDTDSDTTLTNHLNIWGTYSAAPTTGSTTAGLSGVMNLGAPSGIALHVNGSERLRIDSSGRLLVGTSSARSTYYNSAATTELQLEGDGEFSVTRNTNDIFGGSVILAKTRSSGNTIVSNGDIIGNVSFQGNDGSDFNEAANIKGEVDGTPGANDMPGRLVFSTTADGASSPTERMRIDSNGITRISHSSAADVLIVEATNASFVNACLVMNTSRAAGTSGIYLYGTANTVQTFITFNNGNVQNTNNSYAGISDIRLKENIVDANSQWDDLKALQVRNYNFKEETGQQTHTQIGLIAQEVELVSPGLVSETSDRDEDGNVLSTVTKSVNYSVLYMKAVKALQEAMERIETLEARLTAAGIE